MNSLLITPLPIHPRSQPLNILFTEVYNQSHHNILRDRILPPSYADPDILETRFLNSCCQRRILPSPLTPPPRMPPGEPLRNPVMKASQGPIHLGGQDSHICPEKQHRLNEHLKEQPQNLWVFPLPAQYPCHPHPALPSLPQVLCHWRPVVVPRCHHPSHIFE